MRTRKKIQGREKVFEICDKVIISVNPKLEAKGREKVKSISACYELPTIFLLNSLMEPSLQFLLIPA